jgi:hypothetical protein
MTTEIAAVDHLHRLPTMDRAWIMQVARAVQQTATQRNRALLDDATTGLSNNRTQIILIPET